MDFFNFGIIMGSLMGKDEKKRHSKFHRDQMNGSWFQSREPISEVRSTGGGGVNFSNF